MKRILLTLAAVVSIGLAACTPGGAGNSPTIPINTSLPTLTPTSMPSSLPSTMPSTMPSGSELPSSSPS